ncbi:MAG: dihydroorotate dehydrogenase electron transfer subunit [Oscillospiraceae bacterium]|nr:dihydroorotate dehydrogenase electron transfer subunit [Oscillospiraceae bacterium]
MKKSVFELKSSRLIAEDVYEIVLEGDCSDITAPGQFVNIELDGLYLRRPISVCDVNGNLLTLIYKVVGSGTKQMSKAKVGDKFDVLTGLGNGYNIDVKTEKPVLAGGGVGTPPLYMLAKKLIAKGVIPYIALGFADKKSVFYVEEFEKLGCKVSVATVDGSFGTKGFVTDCIKNDFADADYVFTCGPEPMLKALYDLDIPDGQFSFEERMGCGFGACMGCFCETKYGSKRICKDGPVLSKEEIIW